MSQVAIFIAAIGLFICTLEWRSFTAEAADEDVPSPREDGQRSCRQRTILTVIESCEVSLWRRHMTYVLVMTRLTSWAKICALGLALWIAVSACALAQSSASAEARLKELSITLPQVPSPVARWCSIPVGQQQDTSGLSICSPVV